ncbi:MAG: hypothetical protein JW999_07575 [Methanotrichaceae archaeon]|nr:hypothetical protein [Methanotrichaceae archaeon]
MIWYHDLMGLFGAFWGGKESRKGELCSEVPAPLSGHQGRPVQEVTRTECKRGGA